MPARKDIKSILVIGSGPIIIGQACEFDYSATQACIALKEEGYRIILINSNPATIMTDPSMAHATYVEPIEVETIASIIEQEKPDALLSTMGGQTALNCAIDLYESGVLEHYNVELIGARYESIQKAENRKRFQEVLANIGLKTPASYQVQNMEEAQQLLNTVSLPLIVRPSFTLGGHGGAIARNITSYQHICKQALQASPYNAIQIDESIIGWKEFELEVMRDTNNNNIVICSIENIDPTGVHTGDSITVAPAQTLTDKEYQCMREASIAIMQEIGVDTGGANVQFALHPETGQMLIIEMNPRVSRSSALVSKATGYPIAAIAAKLAVGYTLDTLLNAITGNTIPASFEPSIDYVVTKIPRFDMEKFPNVSTELGVQMKSVGEVMAIGRTFQESFQKAICSLEQNLSGLTAISNSSDLHTLLESPHPTRIQSIAQAFRNDTSVEVIYQLSGIDPWFLRQFKEIIDIERALESCTLESLDAELMHALKKKGFSDNYIATITSSSTDDVRKHRHSLFCRPDYNRIDTCAAEFSSVTDYLYSTYDITSSNGRKNSIGNSGREFVIIIGSGPNRIGQGIEFDYCCVHAAQAVRQAGYKAIMVNSNPETVSTDYSMSDRLYFEPLNEERVLDIIDREQPLGVIVQFGGQTALKLVDCFRKNSVPLLGSSYETIHMCEDRREFRAIVDSLNLLQPPSAVASSVDECFQLAELLHFPLILRPSYVIGGSSMHIAHTVEELHQCLNTLHNTGHSILLEHYLEGALEIDVDAVCDGKEVLICGIMEHIEAAGIHSGDSASYYPPRICNPATLRLLEEQVRAIALKTKVLGLINVQVAIKDEKIYLIEVNPRASRTIPFISKVNNRPWVNIATRCMLGQSLAEQQIKPVSIPDYFAVKESVFPFIKFNGSSAMLGPQMKSTGEVMGIAAEYCDAYRKAQQGAGFRMPEAHKNQSALISAFEKDDTSLLAIAESLRSFGFSLHAEQRVAARLQQAGVDCSSYSDTPGAEVWEQMEKGTICFVIHVSRNPESPEALRRAIELNIFYATTEQSIQACIQTFTSPVYEYRCLQKYYGYNKPELQNSNN